MMARTTRQSDRRRKLILHVGPHKTGTSALQIALAENTAALKRHGFHYETFTTRAYLEESVARFFSVNRMLDRLYGNNPRRDTRTHHIADRLACDGFADVAQPLSRLAEIGRDVVLSSENFSRLNRHQAGELAKYLAPFDLTVVYFLRAPLPRLASLWKEWVKHGYSRTFSAFLAERTANAFGDREVNDALRIRPWVETFGADRVMLRRYDRGSDVVSEFFEQALGIPRGRFELPTADLNVNESNDIYLTEILRALGGLQVHLPQDAALLADAHRLAARLKQRCESDRRLLCSHGFSMDDPAFREIETSLLDSYAALIRPRPDGSRLFESRDYRFTVVDSRVWSADADLSGALAALSDRTRQCHGEAEIDPRLSSSGSIA